MNIFGTYVRKCSEFPRKMWLKCWRRFVLIVAFFVSLFAQCGRNFGYRTWQLWTWIAFFWGRKWRQELDWARTRPSASQRCAQLFSRSSQVQVKSFLSFRFRSNKFSLYCVGSSRLGTPGRFFSQSILTVRRWRGNSVNGVYGMNICTKIS